MQSPWGPREVPMGTYVVPGSTIGEPCGSGTSAFVESIKHSSAKNDLFMQNKGPIGSSALYSPDYQEAPSAWPSLPYAQCQDKKPKGNSSI